jgi:hypothetical protein
MDALEILNAAYDSYKSDEGIALNNRQFMDLKMARAVVEKMTYEGLTPKDRAFVDTVIAWLKSDFGIGAEKAIETEIEALKIDGFEYKEIGDPDDYVLATNLYEFEDKQFTSLDEAVATAGDAAPTYRVLLPEDVDGKVVVRRHSIRVRNGKIDKVWTHYIETVDLTKNESWKQHKYTRLSVSIPDALHKAVEAYRVENGLQNFSQALVDVAAKALNVDASLPKRGGARPGAGKRPKNA